MNDRVAHSVSGEDAQASLRDELARADAMSETMMPVLRHLVALQGNSVFSDEILARVRGMLADLVSGLAGPEGSLQGSREGEALTAILLDNRALLAHLHALALEWQLAERLQSRLALDLVRSPLLQALIVSGDATTRSLTMSYLAAQARWVAAQRRMKLPLGELPPDLLHEAVLAMNACPALAQRAEHVHGEVRNAYGEGAGRLGLAARLVANWSGDVQSLLSVANAGVSLFLSALALHSGQGRDALALSTHEGQISRLALALRAAGLAPSRIEEQMLALHLGARMPQSIGQLAPDDAAFILSSGREPGPGHA